MTTAVLRVIALAALVTPASAFMAPSPCVRGAHTLPHQGAFAASSAPSAPHTQARAAVLMSERDLEWTKKLFTVKNAAPWLILVVVIAFEGLATLPRESLPPLLQQLLPLVLGRQYAAPPPS